jgi:hypothetical protein
VERRKSRRYQEFLASTLVGAEDAPPRRRLYTILFERGAARRSRRAAVRKLLLGCVFGIGVGLVASVASEVARRGTPTMTSSPESAALASVTVAAPAGTDSGTGAEAGAQRFEAPKTSEAPVERPSAPVKAVPEAKARPAPYAPARPREKAPVGPAPEAAGAPTSRVDADGTAKDQPDPAGIIDWLLNEYAPGTK